MTLVVDAGAVAAALIDDGVDGRWAERQLAAGRAAAPHLMPVEVVSILRRAVRVGEISADAASMAHADLMELGVVLYPYRPFASRVWELRDNVTSYDGWYVALAESLQADLVTVDRRLTRASGCRCGFRTPND